MTITRTHQHQRGGTKAQIFASWKVAEFWYEYSVTINIVTMTKKPVLWFCYSFTFFLHRMTGILTTFCYWNIIIDLWGNCKKYFMKKKYRNKGVVCKCVLTKLLGNIRSKSYYVFRMFQRDVFNVLTLKTFSYLSWQCC